MNLYQLSDDTRRLLTLDNFLGGLTVPEFVDQLSSDHSLAGGEVNSVECLDPKPYIRTFESTLTELKRLNEDCQKRRDRAQNEVSEFELDHSKNVVQIASHTDTLRSQFQTLDDNVNSVASVIGPLGDSLQRGVQAKEKLTLTIFLIRCYNSFHKSGKCSNLEELRASNRQEDKRKSATTVSQLLRLSEKLVSDDLQGSKATHELILKYAETLEQDLLGVCSEAYRDQDYARMKQHADMLFSFNGGSNVIQLFINNSELFQHYQSVDQASLSRDPLWADLGAHDRHKFGCDQGTVELFDLIRMTIRGESKAIVKVFEDTTAVLKAFMERIYAQILNSRLQALLSHAATKSNLVYVRLLYTLYMSVGELTKDLKDFLVTDDLDEDGELAAALDQCYADLFVSYFSQNRYFEYEKRALEDAIYSTIAKFEMLNERLVREQKLTARIRNLEKMSVNPSSTVAPTAGLFNDDSAQSSRFSTSMLEKGKLSSLSHFINSHLERSTSVKDRQRQISESTLREMDSGSLNGNSAEGQLQFSKVESILLFTSESLTRVLELTPSRAAEHAYEILQILIVGVGKSYVDVGLEAAYTTGVVQADVKAYSLDFGYLKVINVTAEIVAVVASLVRSVILPLTINYPNIRSQIQKLTNSYLTRCEVAATFILKDTLQLVSSKIGMTLAKQRKKDFLPKDLAEMEAVDDTEACEETCNFLSGLYRHLVRIFGPDADNLNAFVVEVGDVLLSKLLDHLKNFQINEAGGLILTTDIARYQSVVAEFKIESLNDKFSVLREIANLFTVQPELLSALTKEGRLARLKPYVVRQFIMRRSDYSMSQSDRFLNGI